MGRDDILCPDFLDMCPIWKVSWKKTCGWVFNVCFFLFFFPDAVALFFFFKLISYNITVLWSFGLVVLVFGAT